MGGISFSQKGNFSKTDKFFTNLKSNNYLKALEKYGSEGVNALSSVTPRDSGATASSWYYEIEQTTDGAVISFNNSNVINGVKIAVIIQYGHGTRNGGYVSGRDYINPAIRPIFDSMADAVWREVTK